MINKSIVALLGVIVATTAVFIGLGMAFDKSENEKQQGLTAIYDVSPGGDVAYVKYESGKAGIYVTGGNEEPLVQYTVEQTIMDISFTNDGKALAYIVAAKDLEADTSSTVHLLDMGTSKDAVVFTSSDLMTELAFDPKNPDRLFYLQAGVFTNYSPITGKHPHDFDVHSYNLTEKSQVKHTDMKKYSMQSLLVSASEDSVFVQMTDDESAQSAEDIFASRQRIFKIPLDSPDDKEIISNPTGEEDLYDFLVLPERDELIYQAVGGTDKNGTFQYELFSYNWKTYEKEQLTHLKEYTSNPKLGPDGLIYFLLDRNFGGREPNYAIYRMSVEGKDIEEVLR